MNCLVPFFTSQCQSVKEIQRLRDIVAKLRGPDGCPWDQVQTHHSLAKCLVEEASETLEAIDREDYDSMREELGDLLLQVVFHALLAEEHGKFDLEEVAVEINEKLIRRHPHVFGEPDERVNSAEEVLERWERIKAEEKKREVIQPISCEFLKTSRLSCRRCFMPMMFTRELKRQD